MSKRGLPTGIRMRHDSHYVEELASQGPTTIGRLISVESLDPNPDQPRVEIGDLTELTASVQDKGVLEPLLVRPSGNGRWMIIAGERRWRAAKAAGLRDVPCIEMQIDDHATAEIALIENLQRKDLTAWEEAAGLAYICEKFGYTHEDVAKKIGKSRSSVTEALSIASLPDSIREKCRLAEINSKSLLLQIVRQPDVESMEKIIKEISSRGINRDEARMLRKEAIGQYDRPQKSVQPYIFKYNSNEKDIKLELRFKKGKAEREEIIAFLRETLTKLEHAEKSNDAEEIIC